MGNWWDVVILGGGTAGCACAIALASRGVTHICVLDAGPSSAARVGESIPPDTRLLLQRLGVWRGFLEQGHEPCLGSCSSWGSDDLGFNDFLINPYGNGWHLDRSRFDALLAGQVAACGIVTRAQSTFAGVEPIGQEGFHLFVKEAPMTPISTRFVVDATGVKSAFARRMGASQLLLDRLIFVYGFFEIPDSSPFSQLTMLEAVSDGWWYAARLPNRRVAVAFASDSKVIRGGGLATADGWVTHLLQTRHLGPRLGGCRLIRDSLILRPAPSFLLHPVGADRWLAVGDAAAAYDPLASQGIYKAISDGLRAADAVVTQLGEGSPGVDGYINQTQAQFEDYLSIRNYFYRTEQRWSEAPFWRRRRERTAPGSATRWE